MGVLLDGIESHLEGVIADRVALAVAPVNEALAAERAAFQAERVAHENTGAFLAAERTAHATSVGILAAERAKNAILESQVKELRSQVAELEKTPAAAPTTPAFGIDVATSQAGINFARAKADGVEFVIVKMGGLNVTPQYVAPHYRNQVTAARAQGLKIGHYYVIGRGQNPTQQADFFVENLHDFRVEEDVLVLDNEALDSNATKWTDALAAEFLKRVQAKTGIPFSRLWHYANASDYRSRGSWPQLEALGVRFWWAAFGQNPVSKTPDHAPSLQGSISDWDVHQFTEKAPIAGFHLDGNLSKWPLSELFARGVVRKPNA